jgi:hypothetical protein
LGRQFGPRIRKHGPQCGHEAKSSLDVKPDDPTSLDQ